jgi:Zn-dependent metalloprotease
VRSAQAAALAQIPTAGRVRPAAMIATAQKRRTIFDAKKTEDLPGKVVRVEGQKATKDVAVDEAYDGLGATFDFYWDIFGRNSIDDNGMPLDATVHYGDGIDNAFWDGERMLFGDGTLFARLTSSLDAIGHELTHGVTQFEGPLKYEFQSGALNESVSDVFGSLTEQYFKKQNASDADWLIGAELFKGGTLHGKALRSMKEPGTAYDDPLLGKDPQPAHMSKFVVTTRDNGGVHINSGIPNKAFFLIAKELGGNAWEKAGRIWYETLRDSRIVPRTQFAQFAGVTVAKAADIYGTTSNEKKVVADSWAEVGVTPI